MTCRLDVGFGARFRTRFGLVVKMGTGGAAWPWGGDPIGRIGVIEGPLVVVVRGHAELALDRRTSSFERQPGSAARICARKRTCRLVAV